MSHHEEQGPHIPLHGSIARLSKLPMPRGMASTDNLKLAARASTVPNIHHDDLRKASHIPRPTGPISPLGENFSQSIRSRYGWTDMPTNSRSRSPVRDALRDVQSSALDTTPPNSNSDAPVFESGNENPTAMKDMHRPHQVSPTPGPTTPRPDSPTKRPFRPPGRRSPTKDMDLPPVSPGEIYTPPKAFVKGQASRIAKPREPRRTASSIFESQSKTGSGVPASKAAQTMKSKTSRGDKVSSTSKSSLASVFKEPVPSSKISGKLAVAGIDSSPALLKPRSRGENTLASSTPPKANSKAKRASVSQTDSAAVASKTSQATTPPRSSAALRETIKEAKKKIRETNGTSNGPISQSSEWPSAFGTDDIPQDGDSKGLLRKRIQQAATSGSLIIPAMNLGRIPTEVMNMYDPENSTTSWADLVALTKMNAADNEITEINEMMFPSELDEDDEKSHRFLGLEVLDLHRNLLQKLPSGLSNLERLHTLNLSGNKLKSDVFDVVSQIPNLKELLLADNQIDGTLALNGTSSSNCGYEYLEVLDLHGNALSGFGGEGLLVFKSLKVLNLAGNKFSSLEWSTVPTSTLTELNISKNDFSGTLLPNESESFRELRTLDASFNDLEELVAKEVEDGDLFPNMRTLNLTGNKMTRLPSMSGCKSLATLAVAENQLKELPTELAQLESLKSADFGNNNIRLVPAELALMSNLTSLNLVGNPLREKKYLSMDTASLKLELEKKLDLPRTEDNTVGVDSIELSASDFRFTPSKGMLDLSSQSLTTIPISDIDLTSEIHTLKLSNNDLSDLPVELLSHAAVKYSLTSLDLSHNPSLQPSEYLTSELFLPNLKSLYIVSTGLTSLDSLTTYLRAPELKEINISCHRLAGHVPWVRAWWPKVTTLLATDNWFSSVDVEGVRGLECLDVRNNEIEHLPPRLGLLGNLPDAKDKVEGRLKVLEVSGNRFRVPRLMIVEKGTEAVLRDLRRMVKEEEIPEEWRAAM